MKTMSPLETNLDVGITLRKKSGNDLLYYYPMNRDIDVALTVSDDPDVTTLQDKLVKIDEKIDGIFAEEPFITVPTQTDASLDATAAVQTALTKALLTGKNLFFPKGIYTISERLIIPKSIKVFGASREDTVIKFTGTAKETTPYNHQYYDESNAALLKGEQVILILQIVMVLQCIESLQKMIKQIMKVQNE